MKSQQDLRRLAYQVCERVDTNVSSNVEVVVASKDHSTLQAETVLLADLAAEHLLQDPDDVPEWRDVADATKRLVEQSLAIA